LGQTKIIWLGVRGLGLEVAWGLGLKLCREFIHCIDKFGRVYEFTNIVNSKVELMLYQRYSTGIYPMSSLQDHNVVYAVCRVIKIAPQITEIKLFNKRYIMLLASSPPIVTLYILKICSFLILALHTYDYMRNIKVDSRSIL
jgi:hypothetical protein